MTVSTRTRRQLYLVGMLPSLLLLLVSARILLVLVHDADGRAAYVGEQYQLARERFAGSRILNPVERWIAPFNEGDARYRLTDYTGAVGAFDVALAHAPADRQCAVRVNLALSHEAIGDAARGKGDRPRAEDAWTRGREVLAECLRPESDDSTPAPEERLDDSARDSGTAGRIDALHVDAHSIDARRVDARLEGKLGADQPDTTPPPKVPPADRATKAKEREIAERNRRALQERHHADDRERQQPPPAGSDEPPVPQR